MINAQGSKARGGTDGSGKGRSALGLQAFLLGLHQEKKTEPTGNACSMSAGITA